MTPCKRCEWCHQRDVEVVRTTWDLYDDVKATVRLCGPCAEESR